MSKPSTASPEERYDKIVKALTKSAGVSLGLSGKRAFGASALQIQGKIFAMLYKDQLVVKLPADRVEALLSSGVGQRFGLNGRPMREWLAVDVQFAERWLTLAREALAFVASLVG